jgi:hypothetical protein
MTLIIIITVMTTRRKPSGATAITLCSTTELGPLQVYSHFVILQSLGHYRFVVLHFVVLRSSGHYKFVVTL